MIKVISQINTGNKTLLEISEPYPNEWHGSEVTIGGKKYNSYDVYDLENHIAIDGTGEFEGEIIEFC